MLYLIDGHNLIPKLGLHLDSLDDENELVPRLQEYCRLRRARLEVYFDGAPPGQASTRRAGAVTAYFVRQGSSADAAIETRLGRLGKQAKNWTVISSDRRVQSAARAAHAGVLSSEEFVQEMNKAQSAESSSLKQEATLAPKEVEEWLKFFDRKRG
jgi:uncharacterized protein